MICPFSSVTGVELDAENEKIHQEHPVEIGTLYGPGPIPKRYVPPYALEQAVVRRFT